MTTRANFKFGGVDYPLQNVSASSSLLDVCDPAIAAALAFFKSVLDTYLAGALVTVATAVSAPITSNVAQMFPYDPAIIAKYVQGWYPMLAVWRKTATHADRTMNWEVETSKWGVAYVLPPLEAEQLERLQPVLHSVSHIIQHAIRNRADAAYLDDADVWEAAGVTAVSMLTSDFGGYDYAGDAGPVYFPAWIAEIEVVEKFQSTVAGTSPYVGADSVITDGSAAEDNPIEVAAVFTDITP